jgi:polar amino acid transport system substrate-binding protein
VRTLRARLACCFVLFLSAAPACSEEPSFPVAATTGSDEAHATTGTCASYDTSTDDALARVCVAGLLRVATDQTYDTRSLTGGNGGRWTGFEADVVHEIATRLGVSAKIRHEDPIVLRSGTWNDRWDMSIGSIADSRDNERVFDFSTPYAYAPASIAIREGDASVQDVTTDLDGAPICVAVGSAYESYLRGTLTLPPSAPAFTDAIANAQIITAETDFGALRDLALGSGIHCAAALTGWPTIMRFIDTGGQVKIAGDPLFYQPLAVAFAKASPMDGPTTSPSDGPSKGAALAQTVGKIIDDMRADGTLAALSRRWYHADLTVTA